MLKKFLIGLILVSVLIGMLGFIKSVLAIETVKKCCRLRSDVKNIEVQSQGTPSLVTISCNEGDIVGSTSALISDDCGPIAEACSDFKAVLKGGQYKDRAWGIMCTLGMIGGITNWIFYFVLILAVLGIVAGGVFYITAMGDPEKASRGKSILILSVIGIVIAVIAKLIPSLVRFFVGM